MAMSVIADIRMADISAAVFSVPTTELVFAISDSRINVRFVI